MGGVDGRWVSKGIVGKDREKLEGRGSRTSEGGRMKAREKEGRERERGKEREGEREGETRKRKEREREKAKEKEREEIEDIPLQEAWNRFGILIRLNTLVLSS